MPLTSVLLGVSQSFVLEAEPDAASEISFRAENKLEKEGPMQGGSRARNAARPRKTGLRPWPRPWSKGLDGQGWSRRLAKPLPEFSLLATVLPPK